MVKFRTRQQSFQLIAISPWPALLVVQLLLLVLGCCIPYMLFCWIEFSSVVDLSSSAEFRVGELKSAILPPEKNTKVWDVPSIQKVTEIWPNIAKYGEPNEFGEPHEYDEYETPIPGDWAYDNAKQAAYILSGYVCLLLMARLFSGQL